MVYVDRPYRQRVRVWTDRPRELLTVADVLNIRFRGWRARDTSNEHLEVHTDLTPRLFRRFATTVVRVPEVVAPWQVGVVRARYRRGPRAEDVGTLTPLPPGDRYELLRHRARLDVAANTITVDCGPGYGAPVPHQDDALFDFVLDRLVYDGSVRLEDYYGE